MKKLFLLSFLFRFTLLPIFAEDVNMTPQNTFSGFSNNSVRVKYPKLSSTSIPIRYVDNSRDELMKAKSVREMGNVTPSSSFGPMNYNQFPQQMDSSNMMMLQGIQNGMQNMYMGL